MGGKNRSRRGRRRTAPARRSTTRGRTRQTLRLPGLREVYDAVIAGCAGLAAAADALDAELWLAANVCAIRAEAPDDEAFHLAMLDLIDEAERDGRRQCLLLLRTMAAAGPYGLGEPATRAAARLTNRSAPGTDGAAGLPDWADTLGETTVIGDCCVWTDVFGEYTQVYCEYVHAGAGRRHGLLFTIDLAFHGVMHGIDVVTAPKHLDRVVPDLQRDDRRDGGRFERVPPAEAAGLLRQALVASKDPGLPPLRTAASRDDTLHTVLPLAVRRVMAMPGGRSAAPPRGQVAAAWPPQRRRALVDEFLAAHPDGWADPGTAQMFAARIVDASIDVLGFPPDRIGLASVARLFGEVLPATMVIPRSVLEQAQQVARAWVRWRTDARDLPLAARRQLRRAAHAVLTAFPALCHDRRLNPTVPYLADTPKARTDGPALQEILHRRGFAVPLPGQRGDGMIDLPEPANGLPAGPTHVDHLDAADPAHRNMITAIGQAAHGTHTRRIPAYSAVAEQLWNDRPAAVWQAARRLSATGLPRQQVLDRLAVAWHRHGPETNPPEGDVPEAGAGFTDGYTAALHALGTAPAALAGDHPVPRTEPEDGHPYEFDTGLFAVGSPHSREAGYAAAYWADRERLVSVASEPGQQLGYRYGCGDGWPHTITLEEIREGGSNNRPGLLAGGGACPPEDCGGPSGYLALLHALDDPADPGHHEAVDRLGADFDPHAYQPPYQTGHHEGRDK